MHGLPQIHCDDNREGTSLSYPWVQVRKLLQSYCGDDREGTMS